MEKSDVIFAIEAIDANLLLLWGLMDNPNVKRDAPAPAARSRDAFVANIQDRVDRLFLLLPTAGDRASSAGAARFETACTTLDGDLRLVAEKCPGVRAVSEVRKKLARLCAKAVKPHRGGGGGFGGEAA